MKKKMRVIALLLGVIMTFAVFTACENDDELSTSEIESGISEMKVAMENASYVLDYSVKTSTMGMTITLNSKISVEEGTKIKEETTVMGTSVVSYLELKDGKCYFISDIMNTGLEAYEMPEAYMSMYFQEQGSYTPVSFFPEGIDLSGLQSDKEGKYYFTDDMIRSVENGMMAEYEGTDEWYSEFMDEILGYDSDLFDDIFGEISLSVNEIYIRFADKKLSEIYMDYSATVFGYTSSAKMTCKISYEDVTVNIPEYTVKSNQNESETE